MKKYRILWCAILFLMAAGLVAGVALTRIREAAERDTVPDTQKLARTLNIIRTSTPENRKVLKVLFYGQSITASGWHNEVVKHWQEKYPNTAFVVENRAIGGFAALSLLRTTEQDIAAFYPDLIIFHVYGDHHSYEKILRIFRSETAADILVQTDHGEVMPEPRCEDGLQWRLRQPAGCEGFLWYRQRQWSDEMSYHKIPAFAKKYGLAVEHVRESWRDYLLKTGTKPEALLRDEIHPNEQGKALMARFFNEYFDGLVASYNGETENNVTKLPPPQSNEPITVTFQGTRLELISDEPLAAWPAATVDGKAVSELDGCYLQSRTNNLPEEPTWPALRRITLLHDHVPQEWTAALKNISPDGANFDFIVSGSVTGPDGNGEANRDFVARDGRMRIEAQDWMLNRAYDHTHTAAPPELQVHWRVNALCNGTPEAIDLGNGRRQYRYVVAAGLENRSHTVNLQAPASMSSGIGGFIAYRPPLTGD